MVPLRRPSATENLRKQLLFLLKQDDEESAGVFLVEEGEDAALEIELDHVLGSWSWSISGRKTVR